MNNNLLLWIAVKVTEFCDFVLIDTLFRAACILTDSLLFFVEISPGTKSSSKMKPIEEGIEDDVFEESAPSDHMHNTEDV